MYERISSPKLRGASKQDEVSVVPSEMVRVFGQPTDEPWDSESLGAFYFRGADLRDVAIYHRSYDSPNTPEAKARFWTMDTSAEFSIGATNESQAIEFRKWLIGQLVRRGHDG